MNVLREMLGPLAIILAAQMIVFVVVVVVLRKLLLSDTMNAVSRMKEAEADLTKKEEAMRRKMEAHEKESAKKKAEAEEELERKRDAAEQDLARLKERIQADAKAAADKIISEAQLGKDKIREQLVREMHEKAVDFAGELFNMVIGKSMSEALNAAFVAELIGALEEADEAAVHVEAGEAEFIASSKLDAGQKAKLESLLAEKFGVNEKINEKIDERILAGLIIKLGSLEIDGSLLNRYREGVSKMKKSL